MEFHYREDRIELWDAEKKVTALVSFPAVNEDTVNIDHTYVDNSLRGQGIAGKLLDHVCRDMREKGINTLYLITDHTSFYERYGWEFLCFVEEEEGGLCRMYVHGENGRE